MEWKRIDPKSFANLIAFAIALTAVAALVGWALIGVEHIKTVPNPTEEAILQEGL